MVVEGSYYEVGRQQGDILKRQNPGVAKWFTSAETNPKKLGFDDFRELQALYDEHCPGITDEIQGFADSFGVGPERPQIYNPPIYRPGNCSQFAILSPVTDDGHVN